MVVLEIGSAPGAWTRGLRAWGVVISPARYWERSRRTRRQNRINLLKFRNMQWQPQNIKKKKIDLKVEDSVAPQAWQTWKSRPHILGELHDAGWECPAICWHDR